MILDQRLLKQQFAQIVAQFPSKKILIAYSGGLDSSVLLHLFKQISSQQKLKIKVVHINHQTSPNAKEWQQHCQTQSQKQGFDITCKKVKIDRNSKQGFEAEARNKRYQVFNKKVAKNGIICTAHHLDDQIETFFIRLLRGSGIKGLSVIRTFSKLKKAYLARPLLGFSRSELENYAKLNNINYIHDESNDETKYDRNYLRHELIPVLQKRYPSYLKTIERSINHIQNVSYWMDEIAKQLFKSIKVDKTRVRADKFCQFSTEQQIAVLRYWFEKSKCKQPSTKKLDDIVVQLNNAESLSIKIDNKVLKKHQNDCYLVKAETRVVPENRIIWDTQVKNKIKIKLLHKKLTVKNLLKLGIDLETNPIIEIGFRQGGETVTIDKVGQQSLKKFFQTHAIPKWERLYIPLIYINNNLIKVYLN